MQKQLSEEVAAPLFAQVADAVSHCHENDIVIRDLKLRKFIFRNQDRYVDFNVYMSVMCLLAF